MANYQSQTVAQRDARTAKLLETADESLQEALKAIPNSASSVFNASDPRDIDRALGIIRRVRLDVEIKRQHRSDPKAETMTTDNPEHIIRFCARCNAEVEVHRDSDAAYGPVFCEDCEQSDAERKGL